LSPPCDVVLGAASGMGAAVARRLAGTGRRLLLADVDLDGADRVAGELDGDVDTTRCDISNPNDVAALAGAVGTLGALVSTAGLSPTMAPGRRIYHVNLIGPAHLLRAIEPMAGPGCAAVLFSSMAGHLAPAVAGIDAALDAPLAPSFFDDLAAAGIDVDEAATAYVFSKRGLMRLIRREAPSWGRRGARLLTLSPGIVDTPMGRREAEHQPAMADMVAATALGRMLEADEVAAVAAFLASGAASGMTGCDVRVDGGDPMVP
jgi:NAD(P)-dependent dehydrogenase (short-subunit alcohol dehydrogenase family)